MSDADLFVGLDVGTQGTKGLVLDASSGAVVARASASYGLIPGLAPGAAEQHPQTWVDAAADVARDLVHGIGSARRIGGVGISGQQHGCVVLDAEDAVIRPAKLWCDTETAPEAEEFSRALGRRVPAGYTASKLLWIRRHEPRNWRRIRSVLLPHDWLNFRLGGRKTMEAGDASGTGFFDARARRFDAAAIDAIGPELREWLPPLLTAGEPAGRLTAEGASLTGLPEGIPIASGGGDNMMSAIGSGATRPGVVVASLGTSGTVFAYSATPLTDPDGLIAPFCDSTGGWLPLLCVMNVTNVSEEVREAFAAGGAHDLSALTREASAVPPGSHGVCFVPYLQGERVPDLPEASAAILGLRAGLLRAPVLFRAALEGTTLNLAWGVDRMRRLGLAIDALRLVGGGSKNPLWRRLVASALGVPVRLPVEPESAALGAAVQALWTARRLDGARATADELSQRHAALHPEVVEPEPELQRWFAEASGRFRDAVARLFPS